MKTSTFVKGLVAAVAAMIAMGGVLGVLNHGRSRPEGVAENWLTAVGDTTRKGVEADARSRAEKIGAVSLAKELLPAGPAAIKRKTAFSDLEVGKAKRLNVVAQGFTAPGEYVGVRFRVHALRPNAKKIELTGALIMLRQNEHWRVLAVDRGTTASGLPNLPSDGGPPPSSAPVSLWLGGLVGAAIIGIITSALVRVAGRTTADVATA
ncbi:MAG: hypothetical protein QOG90_1605 [Actinomycetota bacterium]